MTKNSYRSIVIPSILYEKIKAHIEKSGGRYVSISEVVREAVWIHLKLAR
jgi:Arc/MetJ-type ribon-helix-helix transcriptional regulator